MIQQGRFCQTSLMAAKTTAFLPAPAALFIRTRCSPSLTPLHRRLCHISPFRLRMTSVETTPAPTQISEKVSVPEPFRLPMELPNPPHVSSLEHSMTYKPKPVLRRLAASFRMLRQIRGRLGKQTVLKAHLKGDLSEKLPSPSLPFAGPPPMTLPVFLNALRLGANDPRIAHLHMRIDPLSIGWGKIFEIRRHLEYFRSAGKTITVFIETGGPKEYFLGMGYGLYVPPEGALGLRGFSASGTFVRGVLDKIGIQPQVERIGKYKSAGDSIARTDMSSAQREVINALLGDVYDTWMSSVSEAVAVDRTELEEFVQRSPWDMTEYEKAGLISGIRYEGEIEDALKLRFAKRGGQSDEQILKKKLSAVEAVDYTWFTTEKLLGVRGRKRIAVIRAVGAITSGKNSSSPLMGPTVGSDTLVELIRKVRDDKRFVACLIRCDSPGGSALASDIMWNELRNLAKVKPVLTSQVDVAASGGYYLSMASEIISEPLSLTGSVGVVTAKPSLEELYKKVGYSKENISIGSKYAELLVDDRPFTEDEASYFRAGTELAYKKFVRKAAASRGKTFDEMDKVAQGRVWTGKQAKERGLVDYLGGLERAVDILKEKAGIDKEEYVQLEDVRSPMSFREMLGLGAVGANSEMRYCVQQPLAISEVDGDLSTVSPLTKYVLDGVLAPVGSGLSVLQRFPRALEVLMQSVGL
ncbi:Serine protease SPPA, chloroplastic [Gracilariopsis chorda]|uniref:Serine protease SPPA, chloroplastic n=1 Tax=Gracilariopsis chorda TaxID=448386 RepID=A0A2V3IJ41_9FLOR|nr:Serine protease SPPA, chloroplastic [Gracilariopsis chorda]|eukprot:PXF42068.1 Serine protease SPPA, chloroplastic [Gracilariopsis chorda]